MDKVFIICTSLMAFANVNMQNVQYAVRFRNFTIFSETGSVYVIDYRIFQDKLDHKLHVRCNITEDLHIKNIHVVLDRCSFMNSACEYFQKWEFNAESTSFIYMKNQMWTPLFAHLTPKLNLPHVKKDIYQTPDASLNPKAVVLFYPEIVNPNYFWRADVIFYDYNGKKPAVLKGEFTVHEFVEKNKNRRQGGMKHDLI